MNQHDQMQQMREVLIMLDEGLKECASLDISVAEFYDDHCREDVRKALAAEPAPLVRLTMQEVQGVLGSIANDNNNSDLIDCYDFANAIMDAMQEKNK